MTTAEQYPGPYTKQYCIDNRISIKVDDIEQGLKLIKHFNRGYSFNPPCAFRFYDGFNSSDNFGNSCSYIDATTSLRCNHEIHFSEFDFEEVDLNNFCIKWDGDNPLWGEFVEWLNDRKGRNYFEGIGHLLYYGCFNGEYDNNWHEDINNTPIITLSQWKQAVEKEFKVPEYWHVVVTEENQRDVSEWRGEHVPVGFMCGVWHHVGTNGRSHKHSAKWPNIDFGIELTNEQFYKHILKKPIPMKTEKKIKGYNLNGTVTEEIACKLLAPEHFASLNNGMFMLEGSVASERAKRYGVMHWFTPVYESTEQVITVVPGLDVTVKDGKAYHKVDDITEFVKGMFRNFSSDVYSAGGYSLKVKRAEFYWTGCFKEPSNTDNWKPVFDAISK